MAKLLALDWDQLEARIVVARAKGSGITVDKAVAVPISLSTQQGDFADVAEELTKALREAGVPKCQAITAVGRSMIELGTMALPPAPDDELPEMVRFQAMREFTSLQESSPLDFVSLGDAGREPGQVMAAAIPAALSQRVAQAVNSQGADLHRSVMRPCAFASLAMRRRPNLTSGVAMIISQQADSAELAVVKDGLVVFSRSFRLPPNWTPGESGEPMLGEVRRSIAAAQNQLGQSRVERIAIFGTHDEHAELCKRLSERTKLDVDLLDPFDGVSVAAPAEHRERFAAVIGALTDEVNGVAPVIDFQNPRKKPEPESQTGRRILYGGALAAVVLGLMAVMWWMFSSLDSDIDIRQRRLAKLKNEIKNLQPMVNLAKELKTWKQADRNWLDELSHMSSVEGTTADDFMLESIVATTLRDNRGAINIQGKSADLDSQEKWHLGLDDDMHDVKPTMDQPLRRKEEGYERQFKTTIYTKASIPIVPIAPPPPNLAQKTAPAGNAAQAENAAQADKPTEQPKEAK